MAEHHPHHDPIEDNVDSHPGRVAIGVLVGFIALVVGIVLLAELALNVYADRSRKNDPAMSDAAIEQRIAPVAKLVVDPNAPAPTPPAQPANVAQVAAAPAAGAPKLGDKAAWAPRLAQGKDALYATALKGKGAMPAKGGNPALPDDAVKAAVDYMTAAAK